MENSIKIRFFGSPVCESCLSVLEIFDNIKLNIHVEYIDALDEDDFVQSFCDLNNVEELPHIQVLNQDEDIIGEYIGDATYEDICNWFKEVGLVV